MPNTLAVTRREVAAESWEGDRHFCAIAGEVGEVSCSGDDECCGPEVVERVGVLQLAQVLCPDRLLPGRQLVSNFVDLVHKDGEPVPAKKCSSTCALLEDSRTDRK